MRNPISAPEILDQRPLDSRANHLATDEVLMALVRVLIGQGIIKAGDLSGELEKALGHYRKPGVLNTPEDEAKFATSLAIGRVVKELKSF